MFYIGLFGVITIVILTFKETEALLSKDLHHSLYFIGVFCFWVYTMHHNPKTNLITILIFLWVMAAFGYPLIRFADIMRYLFVNY